MPLPAPADRAGAQGERPLPDPRDTDEQPFPVYQLVPDSQRAWHAGRSRWHHYAGLNASSLGIEIVNSGMTRKTRPCPPI